MGIAAFDQDPSGPPGAGWFSDEYGNRRYAYDPVAAQNAGQGDQRLAMGGPDAGAPQPAPQGGAPPATPPSASDAVPDYGQVSPQQQAGQQVTAPPGTAPQNENQAITGALQNNIARAMTAPQGGASPAGYRPSTRSTTVADLKRPITQEEEQGYESAEGQKALATANTAKLERDKQLGIANSAMASLPRQYANMEAQQKKRDEVSGLVQQDRASLDQFGQELQQNQKSFNANRLFDDKLGTAGTIGAALFRAIGAYAQIKGHLGENPAGQIIDAAIQRDIAEQRQKIDDSRGNVDNALNRLRLHFGDLDLAQKALENIQHNYADTQQQFYAAATNSQQVIENARAALADQQTASQKRWTEFGDRSFGVATKKVEEKYQAGGSGAPNLKQSLENFKTYAEANKILSEANAKPKTNAKIQATIAAGNNAIGALEDSLSAMNLKPDQKGDYQVPGRMAAGKEMVSNDLGKTFGTGTAKRLETNRAILSGEIGKLATGGAATKETIDAMNNLLNDGDPRSLIQLHKLMKHFVRNYQNAGENAQPGEDISDTSDMGGVYGGGQ